MNRLSRVRHGLCPPFLGAFLGMRFYFGGISLLKCPQKIWILANIITLLWTIDNKKPAISNGFCTNPDFAGLCIGSPARTRTTDMLVNSQPLYRLSYWGTYLFSKIILFLHPMITNKFKRLGKKFSGYIIQEEEDVNNFNQICRRNYILNYQPFHLEEQIITNTINYKYLNSIAP